ncbi:lipopolysaccharide biosynthesis protein [Thiolapillus sp.]
MLTGKARSAVIWSGLELLFRQGVGFVISILMARMLGPEAFGTIALLSLFMGLSWVLVNVGFSSALIQRQNITAVDESTVFWFNLFLGVLLAAGVAGLGPWLAAFYAQPVLVPLALVMAFNIVFSAASTVQTALLARALDFRTPMRITMASTLVSGALGLYMAWEGYGVWALAAQSLSSNLVSMLLLWMLGGWRPVFCFSRQSFRRLAGFGGYLLASRLLNMFYRKGYTLLLGKYFGLQALGYFNRAERIQTLPTALVTGVAAKVSLPLFSRATDDIPHLRETGRLAIRTMMLVTVPMVFGLAILAGPVVQVLLGEQWMPAAPILQVLCFSGLLLPLDVVNLNLIKALGRGKLFFRLEMARITLGILLLLVGSLAGVMGIAWAFVAQSVLAYFISSHYVGVFLDYGSAKQLKDCFAVILTGAVMAVAVYGLNRLLAPEGLAELILIVCSGALFYLLCNRLCGVAAFREALSFLPLGTRSNRV